MYVPWESNETGISSIHVYPKMNKAVLLELSAMHE